MKTMPTRRQGGIALLEAMLAIVILGIGLLGTIGLQARAYSALSDAGMRAEATMAGEKLLGVMMADTANLAGYNLAENGTPATELNARAVVSVEQVSGGFEVKSSAITLEAMVPGIDDSKFQELAKTAKEGCPISKALGAIDITLDAKLV